MLSAIQQFFSQQLPSSTDELASVDPVQLASAALMIEVASIDQEFDPKELQALVKILAAQFQLHGDTLEQLVELARQQSREASALYEFTRVVNDQLSTREKIQLLANMWQIAYADGRLDKYEEYIIRKTAELIHVAHGDFIRAKHFARDQQKP